MPSLLCYATSTTEVAGWSEPTLARIIEARPSPIEGVLVKGLEEDLPRFCANVLELPPLVACTRAAVSAVQPQPVRAGATSARVCVAAAALQRWSVEHAPAAQRARLSAMLRELRVEPAAKLLHCTELCAPSGELIERTSGSAEASALLLMPRAAQATVSRLRSIRAAGERSISSSKRRVERSRVSAAHVRG